MSDAKIKNAGGSHEPANLSLATACRRGDGLEVVVMTRSEMQALREDVAAGLNNLALLRIDAELAKPEAREWRVKLIRKNGTRFTNWSAQSFKDATEIAAPHRTKYTCANRIPHPSRAVGACRVTCKCGKPATWAGEFCQMCWEAFCAGEWWRQ